MVDMTVAELIEDVLRCIFRDFYKDRAQDFFRDKHALTRAIARYGVECHSRGWEFGANSIRAELIGLLHKIRQTKADIKYLPVYLEGAVDRHIRMRADELNEGGKLGRNIVNKTIGGIKPAAVREATAVETLAVLYKSMKQSRVKRKAMAKASPKIQQPGLF